MELESALRDRHVACGCAGETLDDTAIVARCEPLDGASLRAAEAAGDVLWNGTIANAILASLDDCDRAEPEDDPVIGSVELGAPCRVFDDVAGAPDDCVFGAVCVAPLGGGEARCAAREGECTASGDCVAGECVDGECVTPVCADSGG